jgi:hypothetical protein
MSDLDYYEMTTGTRAWPWMREAYGDPAGYDTSDVEQPWENEDEWMSALPAPSMEDARRGLAIAAELERNAAAREPEAEDELEMLRRLRIAAGVTRQQACFEFAAEVA